MSRAIPPLPHYALMAWCSVKKEQGQLYLAMMMMMMMMMMWWWWYAFSKKVTELKGCQ
jgi:hypothetical protein